MDTPNTFGGKQLCEQGVYFVTRLHDGATYTVVGESPVPATCTTVRADQDIEISRGRQREGASLQDLRRIEHWDEDGAAVTRLCDQSSPLGCQYDRGGLSRAAGRLKRSSRASIVLKLKTFVGTSENSVHLQNLDSTDRHAPFRWLKRNPFMDGRPPTLGGVLRQLQSVQHRPASAGANWDSSGREAREFSSALPPAPARESHTRNAGNTCRTRPPRACTARTSAADCIYNWGNS